MFEKFTDRSRKVMALAHQEAGLFNMEYLGTECILLGLIKEGSGVAAHVLSTLGVDLAKAREKVAKHPKLDREIVIMGKLPQAPRTKTIIENAIKAAHEVGDIHVGTEHLLLGLIVEQESLANQILTKMGVSADQIKTEVMSLLSGNEEVVRSHIFAITTFREGFIFKYLSLKPPRTVGFFHTLEDAQECLIKGLGDLVEAGWYTLAVIEKVKSGIYPLIDTVYWYENIKGTSKWKPKAEAPVWHDAENPSAYSFG